MALSSLRQSIRSLAANRAFAFAAIATLALGIGANAAIFSVVNGLLLKPLPYPDGERLVEVYNSYPTSGLEHAGSSIPDYLDRKQAPGLEDLALYTSGSVNIADESGPARLVAVRATPSLFTTLRVQPAQGRPFTDDEAQTGADKVVVLSHSTWQTHFAADPAIVGREIRLNDEPWRVIGVMPEGFAFPNRATAMWTPFAFTDEQRSDNERGNEFSSSIGRLKPGATIAEVDAQFAALVAAAADRLATTDEDGAERAAFIRGGGFAGHAKSLREQWVGQMKPVLMLLQSVVVVVLLIACANVANLFLTRLSARRRELSVRAALGADRWRLARQLLGEALLLALAGGVAGVLLAYFSQGFMHLLGLDRTLLGDRIGIDATVLGFTFAIALATGLLFGTVPALGQDGMRVSEVLRESGRSGGSRVAQRIRSALVVVQIALAVCLLVGAGLLLRSFDRVQKQAPGFDRKGVVTVQLALPASRYADAAAQTGFYERLASELGGVPGVRKVGFISNLPFSNQNWTASYEIVGREVPPGGTGPHGYLHIADAGYFEAMGIPLLQGRLFDARDSAGGAPVVVIDQFLADRHFPGGDALGQRLELPGLGGDGEVSAEIIGIVGTVKRGQLSEETTKETYFLPMSQYGSSGAMAVLKTDLDAAATLQPIQAAVARVDPLQPVFDLKSLDARITLSLEGRMAPLILLVIFAAVALLLAAVGIYGVLAFAVQQRTGEIGVRLAIGASPRDVQRLVMRQGMALAGLGLVGGTIAALLGGQLLESQLFGVESSDPMTLLMVLVTLGSAALLACYMPARRATRVAPLTALRNE